MKSQLSLLFILVCLETKTHGQDFTEPKRQNYPDSVTRAVHSSYHDVSKIHRWLFGKNYREEWATPVRMPVIKISEIYGGLTPVREGGGMQTKSLRLMDKHGKEWVIRNVEKTPEKLLPDNLKGTFALDWIDDAMSGQHPFAALVVPPLAEAAGIPHANPVIGELAPDPALGRFAETFSGQIVLIEEREPEGKSDNTFRMLSEIKGVGNNQFKTDQFLRARMLDLMMGDWDRHEDQWRWAYHKKGGDKLYYAVPRDRDQVFHVQEGLLPSIAAFSWIDPMLDDFDTEIPRIKYSLFKTRFIQAYPDAQISYAHWMQLANDFVRAETDEVLESALKRLPAELYAIRHDELFTKLKLRRNAIPAAMEQYYHFINKVVDLRFTDNSELISINDTTNRALTVKMRRRDKNELFEMTYSADITKEIRVYTEGGNDKVVVNNETSPIKIIVVGRNGEKEYQVEKAARKVNIYSKSDSVLLPAGLDLVRKRLSADTSNTSFIQSNPYNVWMPLATIASNKDDGLLLGAGFRYTQKSGFRKLPYSTVQQLMVTHSFATSAFRINYLEEWIRAIGNADITLNAIIQAPDNTTNFFGKGNETPINKVDDYRTFYRTRFDTYQLDPALRWRLGEGRTISAGPSFQFYHMNLQDNAGRLVSFPELVNNYDSESLDHDRSYVGLSVNYHDDQRNSRILPTAGYLVNISIRGYTGLNTDSRSYFQIKPEFTYYQKIDPGARLTVTDRIGGGISIGKPAFFQSMFLGGQGNLLGYLQNRFAGDHMIYNNLEMRLKLFDIASYILPGELGISGFFDTGRVWLKNENSDQWHTGTGGGVYFSPASMTVIQLQAGHSREGWYPYLSLNLRL